MFIVLLFTSATAFVLTSNGINKSTGEIFGYFEEINCDRFQGWAWDSTTPDAPVKVNIYQDGPKEKGKLVATFTADIHRDDIAALYTDDNGLHGFHYIFPNDLKDSKEHTYYVYSAEFYKDDVMKELKFSPKRITCKA
ncbi:MAG: hypothetical protein WCJ19_04145 [bacterium]